MSCHKTACSGRRIACRGDWCEVREGRGVHCASCTGAAVVALASRRVRCARLLYADGDGRRARSRHAPRRRAAPRSARPRATHPWFRYKNIYDLSLKWWLQVIDQVLFDGNVPAPCLVFVWCRIRTLLWIYDYYHCVLFRTEEGRVYIKLGSMILYDTYFAYILIPIVLQEMVP